MIMNIWNHHPPSFFHLNDSILGGILLVGGLYSVLWAKGKETVDEPACKCSEVNTMESTQDRKEHIKPRENQEKGREENVEETLTYGVQQVI